MVRDLATLIARSLQTRDLAMSILVVRFSCRCAELLPVLMGLDCTVLLYTASGRAYSVALLSIVAMEDASTSVGVKRDKYYVT